MSVYATTKSSGLGGGGGGGSGTVTSVALAAPAIFTVSGSPVTTSGTLTLAYSGTALPIANGGTNATSASAAFNNLSPLTSAGDLLLFSGGVNTRLPIGVSNGMQLTVTAGAVAWTADPAVTSLTGDVTGSGPGATTTSIAAIQGKAVGGTTGTGNVVFSSSPSLITPALGTPSALVGTNITGTAAGLTAGNVTTNANLTGVITSVGNATSIASQTGTGTRFVVDTSPTLVTPNLGTPSVLVATNATGTASGLTAGNVTTNANLTGVITSVGNATSIASQTGTGTKFVVDTSPTLVTPNIGAATGASLSVTGQLTSTVSTGTAPLVVSSTTNVPNLNASSLNGVTASTTPTATTIAEWDANKNLSANNHIEAYATTATAAATTTLTVSSAYQQFFTGTSTQTVALPSTSTLVLGQQFLITNLSTGSVTVQTSTSVSLQVMGTNTQAVVTVISTSVNTAAAWSVAYVQLAQTLATYVTAVSSEYNFSSTSSGNYAQMTGNSVSLTAGTWTVTGYFTVFTGTSSTTAYLGQTGNGFYAANGANSSSVPTALTSPVGLTTLTGSGVAGVGLGTSGTTPAVINSAPISFDITLSGTTSIYLVPKITFVTAGNATVTTTISARRVA